MYSLELYGCDFSDLERVSHIEVWNEENTWKGRCLIDDISYSPSCDIAMAKIEVSGKESFSPKKLKEVSFYGYQFHRPKNVKVIIYGGGCSEDTDMER